MSDQTPETTADTADTQTQDAGPVRVPNVSPGARSGLDHEVIGSNAQEAHDANQDLDAGLNPETGGDLTGETVDTEQDPGAGPQEVQVPEGDLESRLAWVSGEGEDTTEDVRRGRADALYAQEQSREDWTEDEEAPLSARLQQAVYGTGEPPTGDPDAAGQDQQAPTTPSADQSAGQ